MNRFSLSLISTLIAAAVISGCASTGGQSAQSGNTATPVPAQTKVPPGMNEKGEVVDSSKVESGHGKKIKGLGEWDGEITGIPAPKGQFGKLQIGMSMKQVTDILGQPSDQGGRITGKAFIPFYFGKDRTRFEMIYKNQGRLIFAGGSMLGDISGGNLIWVINNAQESGYRN